LLAAARTNPLKASSTTSHNTKNHYTRVPDDQHRLRVPALIDIMSLKRSKLLKADRISMGMAGLLEQNKRADGKDCHESRRISKLTSPIMPPHHFYQPGPCRRPSLSSIHPIPTPGRPILVRSAAECTSPDTATLCELVSLVSNIPSDILTMYSVVFL